MKHTVAVIKKELRTYFNSPIAYIFIVVFLALSSWLFLRSFFISGQADMRDYFSILPWVFLFLIPAVSMRLWAEEKKSGTLEVLLTLPVKDWEVILGKFLASFIFIAISLILTFPLVIVLYYFGNPDTGVLIGSYLGTLFLAGSFLSIGLLISSVTQNQIIAFIIAVIVSFIFLIIGNPAVLYSVPDFLVPVLKFLGLTTHFASIARGVIDN
jgi:ABC-2 type transport system permease protein